VLIIFLSIILFKLSYFYLNKKIKSLNSSQIKHYKNNPSDYSHRIKNIPIHYINMDTSPSRREHIENQSKLYHIDVNRIQAINGYNINKNTDNINLTDNKVIEFQNTYMNHTKGELGCTLSHIKAIYNAYKEGHKIAIIMEDDVSFSLLPTWKNTIQSVIEKAPKNWNIINLYPGSCARKNKEIFREENFNYHCGGAVIYIINYQGMKNILNDIITKNKILLEKDNDGNPNLMVADYYIYWKAKNVYSYMEETLFYPFNNNEDMNSTLHSNETIGQIYTSLNKIKNR